MATEPKVTVTEEAVAVYETVTGQAGSIAVIGAFNSTITDLTSVSTATGAHANFGTTVNVGDFKGTDAIDLLFIGASNLLINNITTWSEDTTPVASTTMTTEKLTTALNKLHNEEFNILFIADQLTDAQQTLVTAWLDDEFGNKYCHGQVSQLSRANATAYTTSVDTFNDNLYYINTQTFTLNGISLDLNQSTAYMAGLIASMDVNRSLTSKEIPGVSSVSPEYSTIDGELGAKLLELNIPFIACRNRRNKVFYCVNSELPDGYDLYINRVRDFVINKMVVETTLGEINIDTTENGAITIVEGVKQTCVEDLKLLKNIVYHVEKSAPKVVDVILDELVFDDIITQVNIKYSIKVE